MPRLTHIFKEHDFTARDSVFNRVFSKYTKKTNGNQLPLTRKQVTLIGLLILVSLLFISILTASWILRTGRLSLWSHNFNNTILAFSANLGMRAEHVEFLGLEKTREEELTFLRNFIEGAPMLEFNPRIIASHVETLPWVEKAHVRRQFPNKIRILINEHKAEALWQNQHSYSLIDRKGSIIDNENVSKYTHLPIIVGSKVKESVPDLFKLLGQEPVLFSRVRAAILMPDNRWDVQLGDSIRIKLPNNQEEALIAWNRLARIHQQTQLLDRAIAQIDMRLSDRLILMLDENVQSKVLVSIDGLAT